MLSRFDRDRRLLTWALPIVFGFTVVVWHLQGLSELGLTWDEPIYMRAANRIQLWVADVFGGGNPGAHLGAEAVREVFDWMHYWNPHPPLFREVMAATHAVAGDWLGLLGGYRLASLLWFGVLTGSVVYVGARKWGLPAGCTAGLALVLMPRLVGHAHVAATDMPLAATWFVGTVGLAVYASGGGLRWGVAGSVGFGLAMATKFTGYLLPIPLVAWMVWKRPEWDRLLRIAGLLSVSFLVAWAVNPLAWHDPSGYVVGLIQESLNREEIVPIPNYYFGTQYRFGVPWHYPLVMMAATVPIPLLALAGWGTVAGFKRGVTDDLVLLAICVIGFFVALFAVPASPGHDGVRLFLPVFPFLAILAGHGFVTVLDKAPTGVRSRSKIVALLVLGALFFYPPYLQTVRADPFFLSYYSEAIGGAQGAERRGMEATYWYDALTPPFLAELNEILPHGASVLTVPRQDHFRTLQSFGFLRKDLSIEDSQAEASWMLLYGRKSMMGKGAWKAYREQTPLIGVSYQGVELVGVYPLSLDALDRIGENQ